MTAYKGPTLGSLLEAPAAPVTLQESAPEQWMFPGFLAAWNWCEQLTAADKQYLSQVIAFVKDLPEEGTLISCKVKAENKELFYRSVSYAMIMHDLFARVTFSSDYTRLKRVSQPAELAVKITDAILVENIEAVNN